MGIFLFTLKNVNSKITLMKKFIYVQSSGNYRKGSVQRHENREEASFIATIRMIEIPVR